MAAGSNTFEGGTDGVTITVGNSGGASGDACSEVVIGASCTLEYDSAVARGAMSARFLMPATAAATYLKWGEDLGSADCWYAVDYRKVTSGTGDFSWIFRIDESSPDGRAAGLKLDTTDILQFEDQVGTIAALNGTVVIPDNQWVRIEMRLNRTAGEAEWWLYLDPDSDTADETKSASGLDLGGSSLYEVMTGVVSSVTNMNACEWWFDNVRWSNEGKLGPMVAFDAPTVRSNIPLFTGYRGP